MHTVGDGNSQGPPFGFLDPNAVIHMVHLIPVYDMGHTRKLLQMPFIADQSHDHEEGEFEVYYVGMFSDCDLFMWYSGGADTHKKVQQSDAADDSEEEDNKEGSEEDEEDEEGDESDDRELEDEDEVIEERDEEEEEEERKRIMTGMN
ncbi:hypothetical protein EI94DRAFT_1704774 [Lactarius quietus]|nr:hypothetical protein EI94DRAFT_1704774 [Lactarius quietus]